MFLAEAVQSATDPGLLVGLGGAGGISVSGLLFWLVLRLWKKVEAKEVVADTLQEKRHQESRETLQQTFQFFASTKEALNQMTQALQSAIKLVETKDDNLDRGLETLVQDVQAARKDIERLLQLAYREPTTGENRIPPR